MVGSLLMRTTYDNSQRQSANLRSPGAGEGVSSAKNLGSQEEERDLDEFSRFKQQPSVGDEKIENLLAFEDLRNPNQEPKILK